MVLAQGFTLEDVRNLLGHSSIVLTSDTYGHVLQSSASVRRQCGWTLRCASEGATAPAMGRCPAPMTRPRPPARQRAADPRQWTRSRRPR
ncbi:MAG: hypothetical protein LH650_12825 [Chloroflexi bacterium]|nr:hypothetical protein [Chloroflexota bacterium]